MADSEDNPHVKLLGVKLKSSAVLENIVAGMFLGVLGVVGLAILNAFRSELGPIIPAANHWIWSVANKIIVVLVTLFVAAFLYHFRPGGVGRGDAAAVARLRARLATGEGVGQIYERIVSRTISVTDGFFGDAGKADESWKPRAFGLREAAPMWTAASYDRCLQIALVYPLACIILVWAGWNDAGEAGAALGLRQTGDGQRWSVMLVLGASVFCIFKAGLSSGGRAILWLLVGAGVTFAYAVALVVADPSGGASSSVGAVFFSGFVAVAVIFSGAVAVTRPC
jgi:hypothetical protein